MRHDTQRHNSTVGHSLLPATTGRREEVGDEAKYRLQRRSRSGERRRRRRRR